MSLEVAMPDALVTLGAYSTAYEANLVRAELEAFDLHASLADADIIGINWLWSNALGGVKVQVPESEAAEARHVLELESGCDEDTQDAAGSSTAVCPHCGSHRTDYYLDKRGSFLTWLILGVPIIPAVSKRACADCLCKWRG